MIQNRLTELRDLCRRLAADIDTVEAEKVHLRQEISRLKEELIEVKKLARKRQRLHNDCLHCLYRIKFQQQEAKI